jgi:hypothetical protein
VLICVNLRAASAFSDFQNLNTHSMNKLTLTGAMLLAAAFHVAAAETTLFKTDFSDGVIGKVPDSLMILDGGFAVVDAGGGNKVLELPGAPLDTFGALFGPAGTTNMAVSAKIHGTLKGRRSPTFGVGLNGVAGHKLMVAPMKKALEIRKEDSVVATVPFDWKSDSWTSLKFRLTEVKPGTWKLEGKAWSGGDEPKDWQVTAETNTAPSSGKASVWGNPFAGTAIRFDDVAVAEVK